MSGEFPQLAGYRDASQAARLLAPSSITLAICVFLYGTRIWTRRLHISNLDWTDGMTGAALVLATVNLALAATSCHYGAGKHTSVVNDEMATKARHYGFLIRPICIWSVCLAKCSITGIVLRTRQNRTWRWLCGSTICVQVAVAIAATVTVVAQCHPTSALWDHAVEALHSTHCWSLQRIQINAYVLLSVSIVTNMVLSLSPILLLKSNTRPLHEQIALGLLIAFGLFITLASAINVLLIHTYRDMDDVLWEMIPPMVWWQVEQNCSIIVGCAICLRSPFEGVLVRYGLMTSGSRRNSTCDKFDILEDGPHQLNSFKTIFRTDRAIAMHLNEEAQSDDCAVRAEQSSNRKSGTPPVITKTTEVVHSTEEMGDDMEIVSPVRRASWQ